MAQRTFGSMGGLKGLAIAIAALAGCAFSGSAGSDVTPDAAPDATPDAEVDGMPVTNLCTTAYQIVVGTPLTSRYRKLDVAKSWDQQAALCAADGAHLVVLESDAERRAIETFGANVRGYFWIGLTDREVEGEWKTVKGQVLSAADLTALWGPSQPATGTAADLEDCVLLGAGSRSYFDYACASAFVGVCECE